VRRPTTRKGAFTSRGAPKASSSSQPGDYEVRLHGDWPKREHNLVRVVPLAVVPNPNIVGTL
jgi:hypothetical protein